MKQSIEQMIKVENLSKKYKNDKEYALDNVNFEIFRGEFTALLGPNGAGKTSLINIISGVVVRDAGRVAIAGHDIDSGKIETKISIGIVPQEIALDSFFKVKEILALQSGYYGIRKNNEYIDYIVHRLSLSDKMNSIVRNLSGGMKRRLLIAKALVHKPEILILDEPTAGVDINLRHDLYRFVRELNSQGMTILLTTHYLEEAEDLCGRVILINKGKIAADKSKSEFLKLAGDFLKVRIESKENLSKQLLSEYFKYENGDNKYFEIPKSNIKQIFEKISSVKEPISDISINSPGIEELFIRLTGDDRE